MSATMKKTPGHVAARQALDTKSFDCKWCGQTMQGRLLGSHVKACPKNSTNRTPTGRKKKHARRRRCKFCGRRYAYVKCVLNHEAECAKKTKPKAAKLVKPKAATRKPIDNRVIANGLLSELKKSLEKLDLDVAAAEGLVDEARLRRDAVRQMLRDAIGD